MCIILSVTYLFNLTTLFYIILYLFPRLAGIIFIRMIFRLYLSKDITIDTEKKKKKLTGKNYPYTLRKA